MNIYKNALKKYPDNEGCKYAIYIRFNTRVRPEELAQKLNRKIKDFGTDRNRSRSMTFIFKNRCKNFMLEIKREILKDPDVRQVKIGKIK